MGKRIVIPEFRFDGKPWVVIPKQGSDWYPSLIDHATVITGIGMCEEWKYPQVNGYEGWRYAFRYYKECMEIVEQYTLTENGLIVSPKEWDIKKIHEQCHQIYVLKYDPIGKTKMFAQKHGVR